MKPIQNVLIANRGEIACRILRTLKKMGIKGGVVYHGADRDTPAVAMADQAVEIEGTTPVAAYLDVDNIINACRRTGAQAVHPGFGFLSENPEFPRRLAEEGIAFIGPLPETIRLMGDKVAARSFCIAEGIPIAPSITEDDAGKNFTARARELGMPLLIKASAGGGGKGMHIVREADGLEAAVALAREEALRAFGNDTVYAERYIEAPRHIEVQILADHHGNVIHLGERDCSVQRRFQKVIEESPAPGLSMELRDRICSAAVDIARKAGYRNAGTVEFLLAPDNEFYFLEMNTRIQVEHPVTEMVTGVDIVELQVRIARGEPLTLVQEDVGFRGHALEMRLYAEDPENDFLPSAGPLLVYEMPEGNGVRVDDGFEPGMQVTPAFDPMLAKLVVKGKDREQAIARSIRALKDTVVLGVTVNSDFLSRILSHPVFRAGAVHTGFIPDYRADLSPAPLTREQRRLLLGAAALNARVFTDKALDIPHPHAAMGQWRN